MPVFAYIIISIQTLRILLEFMLHFCYCFFFCYLSLWLLSLLLSALMKPCLQSVNLPDSECLYLYSDKNCQLIYISICQFKSSLTVSLSAYPPTSHIALLTWPKSTSVNVLRDAKGEKKCLILLTIDISLTEIIMLWSPLWDVRSDGSGWF